MRRKHDLLRPDRAEDHADKAADIGAQVQGEFYAWSAQEWQAEVRTNLNVLLGLYDLLGGQKAKFVLL